MKENLRNLPSTVAPLDAAGRLQCIKEILGVDGLVALFVGLQRGQFVDLRLDLVARSAIFRAACPQHRVEDFAVAGAILVESVHRGTGSVGVAQVLALLGKREAHLDLGVIGQALVSLGSCSGR